MDLRKPARLRIIKVEGRAVRVNIQIFGTKKCNDTKKAEWIVKGQIRENDQRKSESIS